MSLGTFIRALAVAPEDVSNETVAITTQYTGDDGGTYYVGYLDYISDLNIAEETSSDYGVWTGSAKTGSKRTVVLSGTPTESTILFDPPSGALISSTPQTVYVYYQGVAKNIQLDDLIGSFTGGDPQFTVPGYCNTASERAIWRARQPRAITISGASVTVLEAVSANVVFEVGYATGESASAETVTLASGETSVYAEFSSPLAYAVGEHIEIRVRANSGGANDPVFVLKTA